MFYDVLMEKKAQRDEQKSGLSLGQKAGVAGAGVAGAAGGIRGMYSAARASEGFMDFLEHGTAKERAAYRTADAVGRIALENKRVLRNMGIAGSAALGGGLALGYGAKKLLDRRNRQRD
jgi:hypothetical protein